MMEDEIIYQVSFVVIGSPTDNPHPGAIMSVDKRPEVGEVVRFGGEGFEVLEVQELTPVTGNFGFLHVTCRRAQSE